MAETDPDVVAVAKKHSGGKYGSHGAFEMQHNASRKYPTSSCTGHFDCPNNAHTKGSVLK